MRVMLKQIFCGQIWLPLFTLLVTWFFLKEKRYKYFYIIYKTWRRDLRGLTTLVTAFYRIAKSERNRETVPKVFTRIAKKHPNKVAIYFEDEIWTFRKLENFSNQVANYFIANGFKKNDVVALLMENRPEYVGIWLGLAKIGAITALINTNLVSKPLLHCISVADVIALIYGSDFTSAVNEICPNLEKTKLFQFNTSNTEIQQTSYYPVTDLKQCMHDVSVVSPEKQISTLNLQDKLLYIYTSGTTGLPKAAKITHSRYNFATIGGRYFLSLTDSDNFYNPLPLYHSTGGMLTIGQCLIFGVTVTLRRKFSASSFWNDCVKYNCTVANYIGETCRYILAAHKGKPFIKHGVTRMIGNGLKKDIWNDFIKTFNVPQIYEFYGSTEGNTNLINLDHTIGAVGFLPFYLTPIVSICLIKYDEETKEPLKDENGFCIKCKPNEPGLLIGKIYKNVSTHKFDGYVNSNETSRKILNNVFKRDDSFFNSGDIIVQDELGYLYFMDRTGDTFRWKGENVATTEIELVVAEIVGPKDIVVYGVQVPKNDGKAGMISIAHTDKYINTKFLAEGLKSHLPSYAIPLFLRIMESLPLTGTFKVKKTELQNEGFNINVIKDPIYIYDDKNVDYVLINPFYDDIKNGKVKL